MLPSDVRALLTRTVELGDEAARVLARYPDVVTVPSGGDVQAAADRGGLIALVPGGTYGPVRLWQPGTRLLGNGATLRATAGPALYVPPSTVDVQASDLIAASSYTSVVQIGDNLAATQGTVALQPRDVVLSRVTIPTHRNRRGFEINGAAWLLDCGVSDAWDPAGSDSQAIAILNSAGPVLVDGGRYSAGSEIILVGGDTMKMPGVIPTELTFRRLELVRPLSWRADGVRRVVKNAFELKTGRQVRVTDMLIDGVWRDGQDGYAVVITPRSGGAIEDVVFERLRMRNVSSGFQITGHDTPTQPATPFQTTGIRVRDSVLVTDKTTLGGRGILALLGMGPGTVDFERMAAVLDGTQIVYVGDGERVGRVRMIESLSTTGTYSFMGPSGANAANWATWVDALEVTGNTFAGSTSSLRTNLPDNTYVDRATFDALIATRLQ